MHYVLPVLGLLAARWAAAEPLVEIQELPSGLAGNVEIPTLGTWDGSTVYCVYSNNTDSIWIQSTTDAGRTWSTAVRVMGLPEPWYITDPNILVDRITVFLTHVLQAPGRPGAFAKSLLRVAVSDDGGLTWTDRPPIPLPRNYVCGCIHAPVWLSLVRYGLLPEPGRGGGRNHTAGLVAACRRAQQCAHSAPEAGLGRAASELRSPRRVIYTSPTEAIGPSLRVAGRPRGPRREGVCCTWVSAKAYRVVVS